MCEPKHEDVFSVFVDVLQCETCAFLAQRSHRLRPVTHLEPEKQHTGRL